MAKFGIGVGEEFPVDDARPPNPPNPPDPPPHKHWHRHGGWHFALHILAKIAVLALVIGLIGWLFHPFAWHGPYAGGPWHHHFGFFPFFPVLLVGLALFAFRRRPHYGYGCRGYDLERWHDDMHRGRGERI